MKSRVLIGIVCCAGLVGCIEEAPADTPNATETETTPVEAPATTESETPVKAETPKEYYAEETRPAIDAIWGEMDQAYQDITSECFGVSTYDRETMHACFYGFLEKFEELEQDLGNLPTEGLQGNIGELLVYAEKMEESLTWAQNFCKMSILSLGENGLDEDGANEAIRYIETAGALHVESIEYVDRYEQQMGY